jgi:hypothetical protein
MVGAYSWIWMMTKPKKKSKKEKGHRIVTVEIHDTTVICDIDTDAGLSKLIALLMTSFMETNEILRDIRSLRGAD